MITFSGNMMKAVADGAAENDDRGRDVHEADDVAAEKNRGDDQAKTADESNYGCDYPWCAISRLRVMRT